MVGGHYGGMSKNRLCEVVVPSNEEVWSGWWRTWQIQQVESWWNGMGDSDVWLWASAESGLNCSDNIGEDGIGPRGFFGRIGKCL